MVKRSNRNSKYAFNKNKTSKMVSDSRKFNQNGVKKRLGNNPQAKATTKKQGLIKDARLKIKAKQQYKDVVDARDILTKMAKTQDVRGKLLKMRENNYNTSKIMHHVRPIGANIIRRTDANGKICLLTNKTKAQATNMNMAIQQQLGILPYSTSRLNPKKPLSYPAVQKMPNSVPRTSPSRINHHRQQLPQPPPPPATVIRKTIHNNYTAPLPHAYMAMDNVYSNGANLFKWHRKDPNIMPMMRGSAMLTSDPTSGNWITYAQPMRSVPIPSTYTIDVDDDPMDVDDLRAHHVPMRGGSAPQRLSANISNVHSRLDGSPDSPPPINTHGILTQTKTKVVVPVGHRIVVSNLQGTVTQDDIRELFEDIGQLLVARLVRPGTAEVIYKNLKDAQKAVDTYHNRQLDGQPMKCLLVNKRPANNPTAPAISNPGVRKIPEVNAAHKLVPDLSTIHKVLFQRN